MVEVKLTGRCLAKALARVIAGLSRCKNRESLQSPQPARRAEGMLLKL